MENDNLKFKIDALASSCDTGHVCHFNIFDCHFPSPPSRGQALRFTF